MVLYSNNLGNSLLTRYRRTGVMDDLLRAITAFKNSLATMRLSDPHRASHLHNLGSSYLTLYERTGSLDDLDSAIAASEDAFNGIEPGHPDRALFADNLGNGHRIRYERTGNVIDLDQAMIMNEEAVKLTPLEHSELTSYLNNLGNTLWRRYERTGSLDDLNRAIDAKENSVRLTPNDHQALAHRLSNLGCVLNSRYELTGSTVDLHHAVNVLKDALKTMPADHVERANTLGNLGNALLNRFELMKAADDLKQSVDAFEEAVKSTPNDHPNLVVHISNYGIALLRRYEQIRSMSELDRVIDVFKDATERTPKDRPVRATILNNLSQSLLKRFEITNSMDDLNQTIDASEEAVWMTPNDHVEHARYSYNLAVALSNRFKVTKTAPIDRDRALAMFEDSVNMTSAPPTLRIHAARRAAELTQDKDIQKASNLLKIAIELLPSVSPRTLNRSDQQHELSSFAGLVSTAAALSLESNKSAIEALQLLELGRGVIASIQLDARSDITTLEETHPSLAQEFKALRDELDSPVPGYIEIVQLNQSPHDVAAQISRRYSNSKRYDEIIEQIRNIEHFSRFLLLPSEEELKGLAVQGPIVVLNTAPLRCDAIIITKDYVRAFPLQNLRHDELIRKTDEFYEHITVTCLRVRHYSKAILEIKQILEWLWDVAAAPVLDYLGFMAPPSNVWPRIWWVGTHLFNILPIHAAGYHKIGSTNSVLDRVISSYTPTIKALLHSKNHGANHEITHALFVSMSQTPDKSDLPYAETEVTHLIDLIPQTMKVHLAVPTKQEVLLNIRHCELVHLACHGTLSHGDPSQSGLLMKDWKIAPLTISDLTLLKLKIPRLAYLSVCHAAGTFALNLLDEGITLAGACQLAGFPTVIGTMWQVNDLYAANVAKSFYASLIAGGVLDVERASEALHGAVRELREATRSFSKNVSDDPFLWAPYIHLGL